MKRLSWVLTPRDVPTHPDIHYGQVLTLNCCSFIVKTIYMASSFGGNDLQFSFKFRVKSMIEFRFVRLEKL